MQLDFCTSCNQYKEIVGIAGDFWTHRQSSYCAECSLKLEWKSFGEMTGKDWDNLEKTKPKDYISPAITDSGTIKFL